MQLLFFIRLAKFFHLMLCGNNFVQVGAKMMKLCENLRKSLVKPPLFGYTYMLEEP